MTKFDLNDIRKLLGYGSQTAPKIIDDVAEEALPLVARSADDVAEVGPQVIGKGTSRAAKDAVEAIDTPFTEITPTTGSDDMVRRMDPRLAKIALATGLIGGGAAMMGGDEPPVPMAPLAKQAGAPTPVPTSPIPATKSS